jgi:hypothetical protein
MARMEADEECGATGLPDLKPWREVGWIFRDGQCIAIERQGEDGPSRVHD